MEEKEFTKGMMVTIPNNLKFTEEKYTIQSLMKKLIGTSQEIERVRFDGNLEIKGWLWDKKDFKFSGPSEKSVSMSSAIKARKTLIKDLILNQELENEK